MAHIEILGNFSNVKSLQNRIEQEKQEATNERSE